MANLFDYAGLKNKPKRNGFDLSRKNIYSISAGELLPVLTEEMLPGDSFTIDLQSFARSQPMNTAAFARMRQYYDFFFVPYHLLWSRFGNFITDVPNNQISKSSAVGTNQRNTLYSPLFDFETYSNALSTYGDVYGLGAQPLNPTAEQVRKYFDPAGRPYDESSYKLMNYLGYPIDVANNPHNPSHKDTIIGSLSPFRFLAYQKIYSDYYRFDQWQPTDSALFNIDWFDGTKPTPITFDDFTTYKNATADQIGQLIMPDSPFTLRYANFKRDLLRGILPSQQYGIPRSVDINQSVTKSFVNEIYSQDVDISGLTGGFRKSDGSNFSVSDGALNSAYFKIKGMSPSHLLEDVNVSGYFNVLALRFAEAAQKFAEIKGANSYDYIKQIQAHFGVTPPKGLSHRVEYLGGCVCDVSIDPVTNQNLTGDNSPQIFGKGSFAVDGKIKYKCDDYGILMCITHVLPISDYASTRISAKLRAQNPDDWPIPEFDSLGLEAVTVSEIPGSVYLPQNKQLGTIGYAPRYYNWKTALDEVHGDLQSIERQWTITQDFTNYLQFASAGDLALGSNFFKVTPSVLDPLFAFGSKPTGERALVSDQFLVNSYFDFKCVRNLSYDGMPY